ncbi:hypothetical protein HWV62_43744 [Athelia sp. TMB]|nr:hypothetical protein HWV62_43744 [Athelia sp. TMB]
MRGTGPPPDDVGYLGDVYLDIGRRSVDHGLWAMMTFENGRRKWMQWTPADEAKIEHPCLKRRYLWCSTRGEVSWYSPFVFEALSKHENQDGNRTAAELITEMLKVDARRSLKRTNEGDTDNARNKMPRLNLTQDVSSLSGPERHPVVPVRKTTSNAPTTRVSSISGVVLQEKAPVNNTSTKSWDAEAHRTVMAEIIQYQKDTKSLVRVIAQLQGSDPLTVKACQRLSETNEKLDRRITDLVAQQEVLLSLAFPGQVQAGNIGSMAPPQESTSPAQNQSPACEIAWRSKEAIHASLYQAMAKFDGLLHSLVSSEESRREEKQAYSAQLASTFREKEDICQKLTVVTKSNAALERRMENLKRVVAKF